MPRGICLKWLAGPLPVFIIIFLFRLNPVSAQQFIRGKVVAADNNKPLAGVSIFISNTSKGTVTDEKGEFTLYNIPSGKYVLVISDVGYQTDLESIDSRELKPFYAISMRTKVSELGEVTVRAFDKNGWRKWGELFRENFVGTSTFAKRCKILNPEAVRIYYGKTKRILTAYSEGPMLIENRALGYLLQVNLENFRYDMVSGEFEYSIFPLFKELSGSPKEKAKWLQNREIAYYGSSLHFYRALFNNRVAEEGFSLRMLGRRDSVMVSRIKAALRGTLQAAAPAETAGGAVTQRPPESSLDKETLAEYDAVLNKNQEGNLVEYPGQIAPDGLIAGRDSSAFVLYFDQVVNVTYLHRRPPDEYYNDVVIDPSNPESRHKVSVSRKAVGGMSTQLELKRGFPIEVFANGSYMNSDLVYSGFWSWWLKMGTLLPYDYQPPAPMPGPGEPSPGQTGPTHEAN